MCLRTPLSPPPPTRPSWGGGKSDGQRDPHPRLGRGPNTLFKGPIHTPLSNQNASNQGAGPVIGQDWAPAAPRQARGRLRADPKFTRRRTSHASTRSIECLLLLRSFAASRPEHSPPKLLPSLCFARRDMHRLAFLFGSCWVTVLGPVSGQRGGGRNACVGIQKPSVEARGLQSWLITSTWRIDGPQEDRSGSNDRAHCRQSMLVDFDRFGCARLILGSCHEISVDHVWLSIVCPSIDPSI